MTDTRRFDEVAATWDDDSARVELARAVANTVARQVALSPSMDVLDFGCGTGLLTLALRPLVRSVTGADTSRGMLQVLEQKVKALGISSVTPYLLENAQSLAAAGRFDLITSSMALHHVRDLEPLFAQFRALLRDAGQIALADLDTEDGTFHAPDVTDVHHLGFERRGLHVLLAAAGFEDLRDTTAFVRRREGREYPVFLITGRVLPHALP